MKGRDAMDAVPGDVRTRLLDRRQRVEAVIAAQPASRLEGLLDEIDLALGRLDAGTYGLCEACGDPIEPEGLMKDPLARFCIDHLTPLQARELEQDLQLAARVQLELLPPRHVIERGWEIAYHYAPRGAVSGDYCDIVQSSDNGGDLVFLLGDISGKGVAASMLMAHLHASVRTLVGFGLPLQQVVERANRVFCDSTMANHYATLVCGRLARSGDAEICNAGHCAPLLVRPGRVTALESTGVPIGLFCVKEYPVDRFHFEIGDSLVLYTDGVTEMRNAADEEYGSERLVALVASHAADPPEALVRACTDDLAAFRRGAARVDDVSIMVIRRTASNPS
jgi:sigma-B regulation protein RsbU (phosphoserine phosphatase)